VKADHRLAHLVKDARRAMERALQSRLAQHGVAFGHWTYLRILWEADGLTQRELSARAGVMEPTTFGALRAMQERGYIERRQRPDNRKNVYVHLTRRGRALERKLVPLAEEVNRRSVRGMTSDEIAKLRMLLHAVVDNLEQDEMERAAP
jgi:MarR family transcriptional regulator, organic hydroperoxide resistance regulator